MGEFLRLPEMGRHDEVETARSSAERSQPVAGGRAGERKRDAQPTG